MSVALNFDCLLCCTKGNTKRFESVDKISITIFVIFITNIYIAGLHIVSFQKKVSLINTKKKRKVK